jgi:hypothetical protein
MTTDTINEVHSFHQIRCDTDVLSDGAVGTRHCVFIKDMVLIVLGSRLVAMHLKRDKVPQSLFDIDNTISPDLRSTCIGWLSYAKQNGYYHTMERLFPEHFLHIDFEEEDLLASMGVTVSAATLNFLTGLDSNIVTQLSALTSLDATVIADITALLGADGVLQTNIDAKADQTALVQEIADRGAAVTQESTERQSDDQALQTAIDLKADASALAAEETARVNEDTALDGRLDVLEADPTTGTALTAVDGRIDTILAGAGLSYDTFLEIKDAFELVDTGILQSVTDLQNDKLDTSVHNTRVGVVDTALSGKQDSLTVAQLADINAIDQVFSSVQAQAIVDNSAKTGFTQALVSQNTDVAANVAKRSYLQLEEDKVANHATILANKTAAQLGSLDTTSSIVNLLAAKQDDLTTAQLADINAIDQVFSSVQVQAIVDNSAKTGFTQALVSQNTDVIANVAKRSYLQLEEDKVANHATILANKTATQLGSLDTTSSIVNLLAAKEPTITYGTGQGEVLKCGSAASSGKMAQFGTGADSGFIVSRTDQNVRDDLSLYTQTEINDKDDLKCAIAGDESWTGQKTITKSGVGVYPLELENSSTDQTILRCVGSDGEFDVQGGNVISFSRNGGSYFRASAAGASIRVQTRGSTRCTFSDKTEVSGALECGSLSVNGTTIDTNGGGGNSLVFMDNNAGQPGTVLGDANNEIVLTGSNGVVRLKATGSYSVGQFYKIRNQLAGNSEVFINSATGSSTGDGTQIFHRDYRAASTATRITMATTHRNVFLYLDEIVAGVEHWVYTLSETT